MNWVCPVCGSREVGAERFEEETYFGEQGAEMKIVIPYCNGKGCDPVKAANLMDQIAEPFFDAVGV